MLLNGKLFVNNYYTICFSYTGVHRHTKDLDIFVRKNDCHVALESLRDFGFQTRLTFPYWLGKVTNGDEYAIT